MSDKIERGTVKFFNSKKGFGFLFVTDERGRHTGEEIYFNIRRGHLVSTHDWMQEPFFGERHGDSYGTRPGERTIEVRAPRPGEVLIFVPNRRTPTKPFCEKWAPERDWNRQKVSVARLPQCRVVRVQNDEVVEVLWTSSCGGHQGVVELSKRFPRLHNGADELSISYARCSDGDHPYRDLRIEVFAEDSNSRAPRGQRPMRWFPTWDNRAPAGITFA